MTPQRSFDTRHVTIGDPEPEVDAEFKRCTRCGEMKLLSEFRKRSDRANSYEPKCRTCWKDYLREWRAANPHKSAEYRAAMTVEKKAARHAKNREWKFLNKYGITPEEFLALLDRQDGRCRICDNEIAPEEHGQGRGCRAGAAVVDHDHYTGLVRGLLCGNCNLLLGYARDEIALLERAIQYLKEE